MSFFVIGVPETWLAHCTAELVNITGYNFVSNHRKSKKGGVVGIYLKNGLEYKLLEEYKFSDRDVLESLFLEVIVPHGKNIIVDCIYRPPNQYTAMFIDNFDNIFSLISTDKKHCYVMRDFNLDLLRYNNHVPTQEFIDSLFSHVFLPLISNPTCLTSCSAALLTTYLPTALNIMLSVGLF